MISWYWIIVAVLLTNAITCFTYEFFDWENVWTEIISFLALIVLYVPISIYHIFFKNTIHPVEENRFEEICREWFSKKDGTKYFHCFGNLYFWIDPAAKHYYNKIFFVRVKKGIDN